VEKGQGDGRRKKNPEGEYLLTSPSFRQHCKPPPRGTYIDLESSALPGEDRADIGRKEEGSDVRRMITPSFPPSRERNSAKKEVYHHPADEYFGRGRTTRPIAILS